MKTQRREQKGFTLVEVMVAMIIAAMIVGAVYRVMRSSQVQMESSEIKMTIQDSAREGLYKMVQELRLSAPSKVTISPDGMSVQFFVPAGNSPLDSDYRIDWNNAHQITYALGGDDNKQLIRTNANTGESKILANDVASLAFVGDANPPNEVTVTMGVQRSLINTRQMSVTPVQISAKAELRNN